MGANVTGDKTVLRVESSHSNAVAETRKGKFAVFTDGNGLVAVAATAGEVRLTSPGGDAVLAAGERGQVIGDKAPIREPIPSSVFLKVRWPEPAPTDRVMIVQGRAEVGTQVMVNGVPAKMSADGSFAASMPTPPHPTRVQVTAVDLAGRTASASAVVGSVRRPPRVQVEQPEWR